MTNATALLIHDLMGFPDRWRADGNGAITNGYYFVSLDATRYGMGAAKYVATQADTDSLAPALKFWCNEMGYALQAPQPVLQPIVRSAPQPSANEPKNYLHDAAMKFIKDVKSAYRGQVFHGDAEVFKKAVDQAIREYDEHNKRDWKP